MKGLSFTQHKTEAYKKYLAMKKSKEIGIGLFD